MSVDGQTDPENERYVSDVVLRDGQTIHLRPIRPDDLDAMLALWGRLSPETIRLRFFEPLEMDTLRMRYLVEVDYRTRFAIVAVVGERIVGVGRFERSAEDPATADFAVTVEDAEHGRGIGTALLRSLMEPARDMGVSRFHGDILFENASMLGVLRDAGFEPVLRDYGGVVSATFTTTPSDSFLERAGTDNRNAAIAAFQSVLRPAAVAVVGASRERGSVGRVLLRNLLQAGFTGDVHPVNPEAQEIDGLACYPSLSDCPSVPELVVVCVPAQKVEQVIADAGAAGARAAIVISTGFADAGPEGAALQSAVLAAARQHGLRLIGPNCMGVVNPDPAVRLNASFAPQMPPSGRIGFSSQSGALGLAVLAAAERTGLGLSTFVSVGNKADLSGNDVLQYWEADDATDVILLYLESFGNPRTFARIARRLGRHKPIVAVKAGRTIAGATAASRHTGEMSDDEDAAQALFEQAGVIRVETLREMFDVTSLLTSQPLPAGHGLAVLTNAGGPGILAADAAITYGLDMVELSQRTTQALAEATGGRAVAANPVDLGVKGDGPDYDAALRILAADPAVDSILVVYVPPLPGREEQVAAGIAAAVADLADTTVAAVFMTQYETPAPLRDARMPAFTFPESAAAALAHIARYAAWRRRDAGEVAEVGDEDREAAQALAAAALSDTPAGETVLLPAPRCAELLAVVGITQAASRHVRSAREATKAAQELTPPLAVKSAAPIDKSAVGAVRLGLGRPHQVAEAIRSMSRALSEAGMEEAVADGFVVQEMVADGIEVVAGMQEHPSFGPVLEVSLGGVIPELLGDVSRRIHPVTDVDVEAMLTSLRGYPLLTGYRGAERVDVVALKRLLRQLGALVEAVPQIVELRLTPVFVRRQGVAVVDSLIRLRAPEGLGGAR